MSVTFNPVHWSNNTKKNSATIGTVALAGAGANLISKTTKGKSFSWNTAINNQLKNFVKSDKTFFGSDLLKEIAGKISKTSTRQKALTALAVGTLALVMGIREHFAKENGKESLKPELKAKDIYIAKQNAKIANLQADLKDLDNEINELNAMRNAEIVELHNDLNTKKDVINGYKTTIKEITQAAKNIGVEKDLANEMQKLNG